MRKDISIQKKLLICGVLVIGGMIGVFYLDDILYLVFSMQEKVEKILSL